ncbi:hypothetical protein GCM10017744_010000 [Streptomyces antimycoticus]
MAEPGPGPRRERLVVSGTVGEVDPETGRVTLELVEHGGRGDVVCCRGTAVVLMG